MVNLLIALLLELGFLLCLAVSFYLGYSMGKQKKAAAPKNDDESIRKAKELDEDFQAIMNYDLSTAMKRKG